MKPFRFAGPISAIVLALAAGACDDDSVPVETEPPPTGNATLDEIIGAVLTRDQETLRRYWDVFAAPCVENGSADEPLCPEGESAGTVLRYGASTCEDGPVFAEHVELGVPNDWSLYSVELLSELRGLQFRVMFTKDGQADETTVNLVIRTFEAPLDDVIPTVIESYAETCETAAELTADVTKFVVPPPDQR